jgi:hypothetical protein
MVWRNGTDGYVSLAVHWVLRLLSKLNSKTNWNTTWNTKNLSQSEGFYAAQSNIVNELSFYIKKQDKPLLDKRKSLHSFL